jgi:predicted nucleotidyltransferase
MQKTSEPIDDDVIRRNLEVLEREHGVHVLYACETGSRAWGFPSPDSDFDVRMVYVHQLDWYLTLSEKKDSIEYMSANGDLDVTGWDIKKCLQLMYKSNGALLERVQSPIVYIDRMDTKAALAEHARQCYSPIATMHHYLGMAKKSFADIEDRSEIKLKTLFYALRAALACKWIQHAETPPPIVFMEMVRQLKFSDVLKERIVQLVALKATKNEGYAHTAEKTLERFIAAEIHTAEKVFNSLPARKVRDVHLDDLFRQIVKSPR